MFSRPLSSNSLLRRRLVTGVALVAYLASTLGYPLPLPAAGPQDASVAFPCQGHACGCNSAAQCWDSCCCYSAAERLAWIAKHQATVPQSTLEALRSEAAVDDAPPACCQRDRALCTDCNDGSPCEHTDQDKPRAPADDAPAFTWVLGIQAQKCQGVSTLWIISGANLPLDIKPLWQFDWSPSGYVIEVPRSFTSPAHQPPVPPPWVCAA